MPLYGPLYRELRAWHTLRACFDLLSDGDQNEAYDSSCGITTLRATSGILEYSSTDLGLVVEISDSSPGNHTVLIKFDADVFVRFLVPGVESLGCIDHVSYPEDVFLRLQEIELHLNTLQ